MLLIALATTFFIGCKDNQKTAEPEVVTVDHETEEVEIYAVAENSAEFNNEDIAAVFEQYLQVQNALINTNGDAAAKESARLQELLAGTELESEEIIESVVKEMASTDDVELQRKHFEQLNDWMEATIEGNLTSGTVYKQYCPMAFNDQGAYWLSTSKAVLNPYFGDVMLKCGRVDAEIN